MELKKGYRQTEVGVIPEDWEYERLDSYTRRGSGHTPSKKYPSYYNGGIIWVSLADSNRLDKGYISESEIEISNFGLQNSSAILHPRGTVIMSRDAGIGKSAVAACELAVSQHFIAWICNKSSLYNWFLYYWLQFRKSEFERIAIGSTIKTIGLPYFEKYKIPIPTLAEQTAIATALSDADALISRLETIIAKKRAIKKGAMQQLLKPKEGWVVKKLGEIGEFKNGINKASEDFGYGFPFINLMDVFGKSRISAEVELGLINSNEGERKVYDLRKGDVVFIRSSVKPEGVGLTCLISEDLKDTVYSGFIIRFRDHSVLSNPFKQYCFYSESFRNKIIASSTVSANTNINQEALKSLELVVCNLNR